MTDSSPPALAHTPLFDLHRELGARIVPFAGYAMPLHYPQGILQEHHHTRAEASLFDVSHMGQVRLDGPGAPMALEGLTPADVVDLGPLRQRYALLTDESGGILDDAMVTCGGDHWLLVVNAARKAFDVAHLEAHLAGRCGVTAPGDRALLALQGPGAAAALATLAPAVIDLPFMAATTVDLQGAPCLVSRSGYTGEDGFELSLPEAVAEAVARQLLALEGVAPAGLGARDSLRLEAGLCLYGQDLDTTTTPVEASLAWAIGKARRPGGPRAGGFLGSEVILRQLAAGPQRRRVGLLPRGRAPVRGGTVLADGDGRPVGQVTSGGFGPSVTRPIAMGYVATTTAKPGTILYADLRGRSVALEVAPLPFVTPRYHRRKAP